MILKENYITLYGITPLRIASTVLTDGSGQSINQVTFNPASSLTGQIVYSINVASDPFLREQFNGWMEIETNVGNIIFSPLSVSSGAYVLTPMLLVLTGVCASVCFWERIKFYKYNTNQKQLNTSVSTLRSMREKSTDEQKSAQMMSELNQRIQHYKTHVDRYILRNEQTDVTMLNIGITEFLSALFGIAVGLVVTYNDIITSNYLIIDISKAILQFSIGLGAGSLKELVDK